LVLVWRGGRLDIVFGLVASETRQVHQPEAYAQNNLHEPAGIHDLGSQNPRNKRDVPYQSLLKIFLSELLEKERRLRRVG
jgi:hypothetical protein